MNIAQSDLVSDFSRFTLGDAKRKEQHVSKSENEGTMKDNDLLMM